MRSYAHLLIAAVVRQKYQQQYRPQNPVDPGVPFLLGSVVPDVPLALLSVAYTLDRRWLRPHLPDKVWCSPAYINLYLNNPWWIAGHNLMHAPLLLAAYAAVGYAAMKRQRPWGQWLLWFAAGCGLHTALDVVSHADDGPALLFPLNWHYRFLWPISYWDPAYWGRQFKWAEFVFSLFLAVYWLVSRQRGRAKTR
jgi:hypothetical protein